jgi:hypothetical protein
MGDKKFPNFIEVRLLDIRPDRPLPCDLYVETLTESRLIKLHQRGETLTQERYRRFREKKVRQVWIPANDERDFQQYREQTKPGKADAARFLIQCLIEAEDEDEKQEAWLYAAAIARRFAFPSGGAPAETLMRWEEAERSIGPAGLDPALKIATFSILFACAVQDFDAGLLADLALACLATSAEGAPDRVILWLEQRHERFDGSGTPKGLKGFEIDDISQLLALSDTVEQIFSDVLNQPPAPRSVEEARKIMESLNAKPPFPQLFNPDLFSALLEKVFYTDRAQPGSPVNSSDNLAA